jgi:hypothetical protein
LLRAWSEGDPDAFERVLPLVYEELHRIAARYLVGERSVVTLQATALVNELCLATARLDSRPLAEPRALFRGLGQDDATVLVDIARRRRAERRGGPDAIRVPFDGIDVPASEPGADLLAVDMALEVLALEDPRKARGRGASVLDSGGVTMMSHSSSTKGCFPDLNQARVRPSTCATCRDTWPAMGCCRSRGTHAPCRPKVCPPRVRWPRGCRRTGARRSVIHTNRGVR